MLKYRECTIVFTNLCNIRCDHCYVSTTEKSKARRISLDTLQNCVMLLSNAGVEKINLTGGEPFLFPNQLESVIQLISKAGCRPTVITNAFWASDSQMAKNIILKLFEAGLAEIHFSTDQFHVKHIPVKNVFEACKAAIEIGIPSYVFLTKSGEDTFSTTFKKKLIKIPVRLIEQSVKLDKYRMKELSKEYTINTNNMQAHDGSCLSVLNPLIDVFGRMFICCKPIGYLKRRSLFFVTDFKNCEAASLALNDRHLLSQWLFEQGPISLYRKTFQYLQKPIARKRHYSTCEICNELLGSMRYKKIIEKTLSEFSANDLIYELQSYP